MIDLDYMAQNEVSDELLAAYIDGNVTYEERNLVEDYIKGNEELMEVIDIGCDLSQMSDTSMEVMDTNQNLFSDNFSLTSDNEVFGSELERESFYDDINVGESIIDDSMASVLDETESFNDTFDNVEESDDSDIDMFDIDI